MSTVFTFTHKFAPIIHIEIFLMLSFKKNPKAPPIIPAIKINIIPKINSIKFNITSPEFVVAEDVVEFKDDNAPDVVPEPKLTRAPAIPIIRQE